MGSNLAPDERLRHPIYYRHADKTEASGHSRPFRSLLPCQKEGAASFCFETCWAPSVTIGVLPCGRGPTVVVDILISCVQPLLAFAPQASKRKSGSRL